MGNFFWSNSSKNNKKGIAKKGSIPLEYLFWTLLAVIGLVIIVFISLILFGKGQGAILYIKDLFAWG